MNAGIVAAVLMSGALVLISIPVSLQGDEDSWHSGGDEAAVFSGATLLYGPVPVMDPGQALVVVGPDLPFAQAERDHVRDLLQDGGRVVVLDGQGAGRGLVAALDAGLELTGSHIFTPFVDDGAPRLEARGVWEGHVVRIEAPVAVLGGAPLLVSAELAWLDENDDGQPGLSEPRGTWPVAAASGGLLVVGSEDALQDPVLAQLVLDWIGGRDVILDEHHRRAVDPLDATAVLAGQSAGALPLALMMGVVATLLAAYRPRIRRRHPKRRPQRDDPLLAELPP